MQLNKLRDSSILKFICYITIPILVGITLLSIIHLNFLYKENIENEEDYIKTELFSDDYYYFIRRKITECNNSNKFIKITEDDNIHYYIDDRYSRYNDLYSSFEKYINYIIVDKETNEIYTNIKSEDYEQEIKEMNQNEIYWNYKDGKITTNIENINQNNIKYKNYSEDVIEGYDIYTSFDENKTSIETNFSLYKDVYTFFVKYRNIPIYTLFTSLILLVIIAIYLFNSIGHKKGKDGITLSFIDEIPYEVLSIICLTVVIITLNILSNIIYAINYITIIIATIAYFICYASCCVMGVTTIKRLKAKKFIKSFLIYRIVKWFYLKIKKLLDEFKYKSNNNTKIFMYYWGFILVSIILASMFSTGIAMILLIAFWIWIFYKIKKYNRMQENIKNTLKDIYEGKEINKINEEELTGILKEMAIYVNDISDGFSNAIEQNLKSERLKTELITNVSHDIKTPLTSIINYVDLLKNENLENEKVKEYIDILDKKSQRLKKLTEDLVEASKFSSGNIKLNIENIDVKELINQTAGEFEDRFKQKGLILECKMPEQQIKVKADNRYMYRIMDNVFSNITKYALENSRVYVDVFKNQEKIKIEIKNISKDKLNISSEELMQRFVRGDKSRYTEGSGLGLSIAESLAKLQGGSFKIIIDGDLFKVNIEFPQ